jgi:hypothetical protein
MSATMTGSIAGTSTRSVQVLNACVTAVADLPAEQRRRVRVAALQVLGDLPGVAHHRFAILDHRHGLAAGERDRRLVRHAHRHRVELEALVAQRHAGAPGEQAVAPLVFPPSS